MILDVSMEMKGWTWNGEAEFVVPVWLKGNSYPHHCPWIGNKDFLESRMALSKQVWAGKVMCDRFEEVDIEKTGGGTEKQDISDFCTEENAWEVYNFSTNNDSSAKWLP